MSAINKDILGSSGSTHTFENVKDIYFLYITDEIDRQNILRAYEFAHSKHEGQLRKKWGALY